MIVQILMKIDSWKSNVVIRTVVLWRLGLACIRLDRPYLLVTMRAKECIFLQCNIRLSDAGQYRETD